MTHRSKSVWVAANFLSMPLQSMLSKSAFLLTFILAIMCFMAPFFVQNLQGQVWIRADKFMDGLFFAVFVCLSELPHVRF